ncbi:sugar phosphate isomerase/epimerase [Pantoea sp. LMR881]|uniref:sugar phosphate isomerase/epimerase family protein n=1 Tax=Pantoea sp. LMR881 TaxID=3014336 RepID=UPI0022AF088F|nr:sugar phosphate isomerase/epimerase [Pantoea sp. LMR881]MCZ4059716.1 sugar phosphate isomerase/epimerase [Pantoea sp. LMR881]
MKAEIIVVTAAYGHQQIAELGGQLALLPIIQQAGADGVEIRRELFDDATLANLPALAEAVKHHQLKTSYSVPDSLFCDDGGLNPQLKHYVEEARQLNAQRLKIALGNFTGDLATEQLRALLADFDGQLAVENDQTEHGKLAPSQHFFAAVSEAGLPVSMTFDMANWCWTQEDAEQAAVALGKYVSYVHVKAAVPHKESFRAIALDDADDSWRTLLAQLPASAPRGIEFPLAGSDLTAVTRHYVTLLRNV